MIEQELGRKPSLIVGLTAHSIHDTKLESLAAGMNELLTKPIRATQIQNLLAEYKIQNTDRDPQFTDSVAQIFTEYPLLDSSASLETLGSREILIELLPLFLNQNKELFNSIKQAWDCKDLNKVDELTHQLKSSALYLGAVRMQQCCDALEQHFKQQKPELPDALFKQFCEINSLTQTAVKEWLKDNI